MYSQVEVIVVMLVTFVLFCFQVEIKKAEPKKHGSDHSSNGRSSHGGSGGYRSSYRSGGAGGGSGGNSGGGGGAHGWYGGYNHFWYGRYSSAYAPRWQGWGWTGDRAPAATYRTAGSGLPQAWDSGSRRLAPARSLASIAGDGALSARTEAVSRAGFGSTGRSYSSGG